MNSMRIRRLFADWEGMKRLGREAPLLDVRSEGEPPERYVVTYHCKGLLLAPGMTQPSISSFHQIEVYLHANYPRQQPRLTCLTEIFHPNILSYSRNGGVCIGGWTPAELLPELCLRIGEMIQYRSYNPDDPLDVKAAAWARQHPGYFPVDPRPLVPVRALQPSASHLLVREEL